jgi:hypothetical protein
VIGRLPRHRGGSSLAGALVLAVPLLSLTARVAPAALTDAPPLGDASALVRPACGLPDDVRARIARGWRPDRGGDIQLVPDDPNFVSGGLSHAGPFDYLQEVPMFWYGPGFIRPGTYDAPVTLADVAPTQGALLNFDFDAPDGRVLDEALVPAAQRQLPKLVVTLVWDASGRNVLDTWPKDWPYLDSLLPRGAWFEHASVGAAPSNTPPSHAIIGTGAFPARTGVVDEYVAFGDTLQKPYDDGPGALLLPTISDLYDRAMDNDPLIGTIATLDPHVGMMGHGAMWGGGDRDVAVTRQLEGSVKGGSEGLSWNLTSSMAPFYTLPPYVNEIPGFKIDIRRLDQADGAADGKWRGNSIAQLANGFDTPARTPYQTRLIQEIVEREGFGRDRVPDLLYLNYKAIDTIGHIFSVNSPEMQDALAVQDPDLRVLVEFLDHLVGHGDWVMALIADHGHQFDPAVSGAFQIDIQRLESAIVEGFDDDDATPLIQWVRPTEVWLDTDELAQNGHTLAEVSSLVMRLTKEETVKDGETVRSEERDDRVFRAVFPSALMTTEACFRSAA